MDSIESLKLQTAMRNRKLKNHHHLLYSFIPYLLTALTCSLFCSYPFWLPSVEHFLFITLPHVGTSLLSPNYLFLVVNAIVAFLLGQSKLEGLHSSAASRNKIYEEYVERSRTRNMPSACPGSKSSRESEDERLTGDEVRGEEEGERKKESGDDNDDKQGVEQEQQQDDDEEKEETEKESGDDNDDKQEAEQKQQEDDGEEEKDERNAQEEDGIPAEELQKKIEEFIARVNRQRWLEARSLMRAR
ncbi:hypothetical protein NL676_032641 [Syzygium grande]|nr:hypothetical protein NL676_032641 [Syzygium grande]